jgi:hypothetical protein
VLVKYVCNYLFPLRKYYLRGFKMKKNIIVVFIAILLSACDAGSSGSKVEGTYIGNHGLATLTFKSDGMVLVQNVGSKNEMSYKVEGDKIKISGGGQLSLNQDGSLDAGRMGGVFKKKDGNEK